MISIENWNARFSQQAEWTKDVRKYLFTKANIHDANNVLDIGCGTGALLKSSPSINNIQGLDIDFERLRFAKTKFQSTPFSCGDAHYLPYSDDTFDISFCHFLLLWVENPEKVIDEMVRIGKPGGYILILAEPDYGGRIDYPEVLHTLGQEQAEGLRGQGSDPNAGRKLSKWLHAAGLIDIEVGILGNQWKTPPTKNEWDLEWQILEADLGGRVPGSDIMKYKDIDWEAWQNGSRVLFVPTFYAIGIIP